MTGSLAESAVHLEAPEAIYNCPECSHWLPPGTLACPDCHAIVYAGHLKRVATEAMAAENASEWGQAKALWQGGLQWLPAGTKQFEAVEQRIDLLDKRLRSADDLRAKWTRRLGPFAPALFFLAKAKTLLFFLFKAKFLFSFLLSFGFYWAIFGWKFGLGFMLSILVHESGHYVAAKRRGLKVDLPVFLPGLGAYVRWYSAGINLDDLAGIALAGPFFGLMFAVVCGGIAMATGSALFSALANVSAWLNLLNLIPVFGLDGDQATYALDRAQRWMVMATAFLFFLVSNQDNLRSLQRFGTIYGPIFSSIHEWVFLLIGVGMGWRIYRGGAAEQPNFRTMVRYVLLIFALGMILFRFPDVVRRF